MELPGNQNQQQIDLVIFQVPEQRMKPQPLRLVKCIYIYIYVNVFSI